MAGDSGRDGLRLQVVRQSPEIPARSAAGVPRTPLIPGLPG